LARSQGRFYILPNAGMSDERKELGTIVVLELGVVLLDVVREGETRVVIYRDTRNGLYHWYELEFLEESVWQPISGSETERFRRATTCSRKRSRSLRASLPRTPMSEAQNIIGMTDLLDVGLPRPRRLQEEARGRLQREERHDVVGTGEGAFAHQAQGSARRPAFSCRGGGPGVSPWAVLVTFT